MKLRLTECMHTDCGLFQDLATYSSIDKYVQAILNGEDQFRALDVKIKFGGQGYIVRDWGKPASDAEKTLAKLRHQPVDMRMIPNDTMTIIADSFERELYIDLDPETALSMEL